jgi:hypothetical protein
MLTNIVDGDPILNQGNDFIIMQLHQQEGCGRLGEPT